MPRYNLQLPFHTPKLSCVDTCKIEQMIYSLFTAPHFPFSPLQIYIFFLLPPAGWGNPSSAAIPIHCLDHSVLPISAHIRWLSVWCAQEDRFFTEKATITHTSRELTVVYTIPEKPWSLFHFLPPSQQKPWSLRYLLLPVLLCGTTKAWESSGCVSGSAEDAATETRDGGVSAAVCLHLWLYVWVH